MADLDMSWSGDLSVSVTGDLAVVVDPSLGTERVLRRLLTNPGDYIWNPDYGAGLGALVGRPVDVAEVEAQVRTQMSLEAAVSSIPEPIISVTPDVAGRFYLQIRYQDAMTSVSTTVTTSLSD